jgi:hypothetical protein
MTMRIQRMTARTICQHTVRGVAARRSVARRVHVHFTRAHAPTGSTRARPCRGERGPCTLPCTAPASAGLASLHAGGDLNLDLVPYHGRAHLLDGNQALHLRVHALHLLHQEKHLSVRWKKRQEWSLKVCRGCVGRAFEEGSTRRCTAACSRPGPPRPQPLQWQAGDGAARIPPASRLPASRTKGWRALVAGTTRQAAGWNS